MQSLRLQLRLLFTEKRAEKHLARTVHDLYFEPNYEGGNPTLRVARNPTTIADWTLPNLW
jgi:hypothetical protein